MKFTSSVLALAASFAVVSAQSLGDIPSCAITCFAAAVPAAGCGLTDTKCQCTTGQQKITESVAACVPSKCSAEDQAKLIPAVEKLCAAAGVTLTNIPTAAASTSGSVASSLASNAASRTASMATGTTAPSSTGTGAAQSTGAASSNTVAIGGLFAVGLAALVGL
ncbi:hypothetical protein BCR34DRAFT_596715 [Clohesyomyces aquaticus]|uniref:CFEM domain-containing protein n=1 Tax=Clohesyomyces aquaticus TaxID=1231657 RepID=A0A1Y2A6C2_9PLEO|nr:hypothetical protein BCR34DRAFT_596715 [Clohesyomyces aquaticus]